MYEHRVTRKLGLIDVNKSSEQIELRSFWCSIVRTEWMNWYTKEHSHSFWELHLCLQGTSRMQLGEETVELTEGNLLFLPPQRKHTILHESKDFVKFVWGVSFEDPEVESVLLEEYSSAGLLSADEEMIQAVSQMIENAADDRFGAYELLKHSLYRIFVILVRKARKLKHRISQKENRKEMELILDYVGKNLGATVEEVSSACYLSESTVERLCRAEYKMTFHQLRQTLRAERIRELLHDTELSFDQIAAATGFADRYSMSKFFKKQEGSAPGNFRRSLYKK